MTKSSRLSRNDITELRELFRSSSRRNESGRVPVEGYRAISGAHRAGAKFQRILVTNGDDSRIEGIPGEIVVVDEAALERIATTTSPQHALALCSMPITSIDDVVSGKLAKKSLFVLDNVSDPGNMGTIIRSAVAFGVGGIITVGGCDPFHPKVVRASAGTIFACPILSVEQYQIDEVLARREIFAAEASCEATLESVSFPRTAAIVFGSEAHGIITPFFQNTHPFTIPMAELCESLNVAMTATIVAHHMAIGKTST